MSRACFGGLMVLALLAINARADEPAPPRLSEEGRFLYADDDDWDWASPLGGKEQSRLNVYGRMIWSALDWMEEGLTEVRGLLIGTPPELGDYLSMVDLNRLRKAGAKRSYEQVPHKGDLLRALVKDKTPPNLIIMMQDVGGKAPEISAADVTAAVEFVRRGGRLIILDDWRCYRVLVEPFAEPKHFPTLRRAPVAPTADVQKLRPQFAEQVKLLDSTSYATRERASAALLKMGPPIVPWLREFQPTSLEQRQRIAQLLLRLDPPKAEVPDDWVRNAYQRVRDLHQHSELRGILRDGNQRPGLALLLRLPVEKK